MRTLESFDLRNSWIGLRIQEGPKGLLRIRAHLLSNYREALEDHVLQSRVAASEEAATLVKSFLDNRLKRRSTLLPPSSTCRVRHQLRSELIRALAGAKVKPQPPDLLRFESLYARSLVKNALARLERVLISEHREIAWESFLKRYCRGLDRLPPNQILRASRVGLQTKTELGVVAARRRFRLILRHLLFRDGVHPAECDREIRHLLRVLAAA